MKKLILGVLFFSGMCGAYAGTAAMNESLVKIIEQLDALKPLINRASITQDKTSRYQIHFYKWMDKDGVSHNGIFEDIEAIKYSLKASIDRDSFDPVFINPIKNDYVR
jgi:hypothetical protein